MKNYALTAAALALTAGAAHAGGLDRSGTPIDALFEKGNYAELSFAFIKPHATGSDNISTIAPLPNNSISNVANNFTLFGGALKMDLSDQLSFAVIFDQPYGSDVRYGGSPFTSTLGGTYARAKSNAITGLVRFKFNENISLFGGPRVLKADGNITLSGAAYGPLNGYNVNLASDEGFGYVVGTAFEIPKYAMRASVVYHSSIDLKFNSNEIIPAALGGGTGSGTTKSELPQSIKLSLQSGISQNTLVFGSFRWSDWSAFNIDPPHALVPNLASLDDSYTFELGVGHRFSDKISARITGSLDLKGSDSLVSPLAPTNGKKAISIGGKYKFNDSVDISGGIRYTFLGDAHPQTANTARGTFSNNYAISVGVKLGFHF